MVIHLIAYSWYHIMWVAIHIMLENTDGDISHSTIQGYDNATNINIWSQCSLTFQER